MLRMSFSGRAPPQAQVASGHPTCGPTASGLCSLQRAQVWSASCLQLPRRPAAHGAQTWKLMLTGKELPRESARQEGVPGLSCPQAGPEAALEQHRQQALLAPPRSAHRHCCPLRAASDTGAQAALALEDPPGPQQVCPAVQSPGTTATPGSQDHPAVLRGPVHTGRTPRAEHPQAHMQLGSGPRPRLISTSCCQAEWGHHRPTGHTHSCGWSGWCTRQRLRAAELGNQQPTGQQRGQQRSPGRG